MGGNARACVPSLLVGCAIRGLGRFAFHNLELPIWRLTALRSEKCGKAWQLGNASGPKTGGEARKTYEHLVDLALTKGKPWSAGAPGVRKPTAGAIAGPQMNGYPKKASTMLTRNALCVDN